MMVSNANFSACHKESTCFKLIVVAPPATMKVKMLMPKPSKNSSHKNENWLKMSPPSVHPRCRWVCFFIRFGEMSQQWMLCSEWVPSEWESDKNITIIHTPPVRQLTSGEDKSSNKSSIKTFLTKKVYLLLPPTKKWLKIQPQFLIRAVLAFKQCLISVYFSPDLDQNTFSLHYYGLYSRHVF